MPLFISDPKLLLLGAYWSLLITHILIENCYRWIKIRKNFFSGSQYLQWQGSTEGVFWEDKELCQSILIFNTRSKAWFCFLLVVWITTSWHDCSPWTSHLPVPSRTSFLQFYFYRFITPWPSISAFKHILSPQHLR